MAAYHYPVSHYQPAPSTHASHNSHAHGHHGRSRRGPRINSQNAQRHYKPQRSPKEVPEPPAYNDYLRGLEAARGFEFDDDEVFCPFNLLTEDDVRRARIGASNSADKISQLLSINSASSSEKGSLSSGSPDGSPVQQQVQPTPSLLIPQAYPTGYQQHSHQMKLHQPLAQRSRNPIPIVDPSTRSVASPPMSISPARQMQQQQHQYAPRRW